MGEYAIEKDGKLRFMRRQRRADSSYVGVRLKDIDLERNARPILRDICWNIQPGQRWILAGGNGAGKTQLLKLVAGSVWPTPTGRERRRYVWRGENWSSPFEVKEEIGYVGAERQDKYERYGWNHTVGQIVGTGLHRTDIPLHTLTPADRHRVSTVLLRLGIQHLAERPFLSLSYGERRLTLLARTLASRSKLLLLDELLNGLDEVNRERALRWLRHTTRSRLPWVLTTHRVEDVPDCVTHALVLEHGRIVYRGKAGAAPLRRWLNHEPRRSPRVRRPRARNLSDGAHHRTQGAPLLKLTRASVYLDEHIALRNISLEVRKGQCWVVHGRNGSGKTTLLRTLYGDHGVAVGGRIERAGIEPGVPLQVFKTRVGLVAPHLQTRHPQEMTVTEVVQSGRHASIGLNDPPTAADRAAAKRALEFFGLAQFAGRTLVELSYGQLRRVLFARAWVPKPQLLLLDEPFAGVDGPTRHDLQDHLEALLHAGVAVVVATHHRSEWPASTTHELELAAGHAVYCGPVRKSSPIGSGRTR
jgi:molybdate transport system ATP-binding protein